jgi:hypothetical protein
MLDRTIPLNLTKVAAATVGMLGLTIVVVDCFWINGSDDVGHIGLAFIAGGAVLRVRSYFCALQSQLREVFEMGRVAERQEAAVRKLR